MSIKKLAQNHRTKTCRAINRHKRKMIEIELPYRCRRSDIYMWMTDNIGPGISGNVNSLKDTRYAKWMLFDNLWIKPQDEFIVRIGIAEFMKEVSLSEWFANDAF